MKPVIDLLHAIQHVFHRNRQQGSTTRLKEIAEKYEVYIIAANDEQARQLGPAGVSMQQIIRQTERNRPRAYFFDNYAINMLCTQVLQQFNADAEAVQTTKKAHQAEISQLNQEVIVVMNDFKISQRALTSERGENAGLLLQLNAIKQELLAAKIKLNVRQVARIIVKRRK